MYSLIKDEGKMTLKVYKISHNDIDFMCQINNVEEEHPRFVEFFTSIGLMHENILIYSEKLFFRIYDTDIGTDVPSI